MDMEKVETDNIAVVQARALKKYCADQEGCCSCVFDGYDEEGQPVCKIAPMSDGLGGVIYGILAETEKER